MKKLYLAWIGQKHTTFGSPHKKTGRLSLYGELQAFDSKQERDMFCDEFSYHFNSYPVATNRKEAKTRYFAGLSQNQFDEYLKEITFRLIN